MILGEYMELEELYEKNLEYLKINMPDLYTNIINTDISEYEIIQTNGQINVTVNGNKLYPDDVRNAIQVQFLDFLQKPSSFFKKPTRSFDEGLGYIHDKYIMDIEASSPYLKEKRIFTNYHHNMDKLFPYLLVMGVGLGYHIELLMRNCDIKNLVIIDEDYCFTKISMHFLDWRPIFEFYSKTKGYQLSFFISKNAINLSKITINALFKQFPYLQYYIPYYLHYNSNFFQEFKEAYLAKTHLGYTGLGFYDDEILSLDHTIQNINNNREIFLGNKSLPENSSVFIVGTGPSVDKDIEIIKKFRNQAIIISCGTALKIFEAHNIIPDFHMESERPPRMYEYIAENISLEFLKQVNFIGLNVIYPKVLSLFKSAKIVFRNNDCGSTIVPDTFPKLDHCNPTVVNAAVTFTSELGFNNIYLFGTDMGYKDESNHHSQYSSYNDPNSKISKLLPRTLANKTFKGNFDQNEKFLSTDILTWCKQRVENCINDYLIRKQKSINYINCSDGLYIEKTTPLHSKEISIEQNKTKILNIINQSFSNDFTFLHKNIKEKFIKEKEIYFANLDNIIKILTTQTISNYSQMLDTFDSVFYIASDVPSIDEYGEESSFTRSLLRGTTYHFFSSIYTHALAMSDKNESLNYINESLKKYISFLEYTKKDIKDKTIN